MSTFNSLGLEDREESLSWLAVRCFHYTCLKVTNQKAMTASYLYIILK